MMRAETQAGAGSASPARRGVCLFAQFDPAGRIPPTTRHYLTALAGCGLTLHVACAGIRQIAGEDADFLARIGAHGHARPNAGLDFGAWADLLRAGCAQGAAGVLLANDSVFGPFADLRPLFDRMRGHDAWGLVESHERVWHLQSWFVWLGAAVLDLPAIRRVFAQDFAPMGKEEIILHGELGLGVALRTEGVAADAVWRERSRLRRLLPVNPSHFDWRAMLTSGAVPFIKAELLRDNPARLADLADWRSVVALCGGDPAAIEAALAARTEIADAGQPMVRPAPVLRRVLNAALVAAGRQAP